MMAKSEEGQEDRPVTLRSAALMALLGLLALATLSGVAGIVRGLIATDTLWGPWTLKTGTLLVANLLVCIAAIVILLKFKSQRVTGEPVSPATRRARMLFGLSGLIAAAAMVVMVSGRHAEGHPTGLFPEHHVSTGIALFAIAAWVLGNVIAWWWYASADEHERRANDVGFLAGGGLFLALAPAWWIASRAGLVRPPDAMVLWFITVVAMGIGWFWRRYR
jgi:hypothetical protein